MSTTAPRPGETGIAGRAGLSGTGPGNAGPIEPAASRAPLDPSAADRAARTYWEAEADAYQAEHGAFLAGARPAADEPPVIGEGGAAIDGADIHGAAGFVWGPEGLSEAEARLLGPVAALAGQRVLEVGCGAAQCSEWLAARGAQTVGIDIAVNQLRHARPRHRAGSAGGPGPDGTRDRAEDGGTLADGGVADGGVADGGDAPTEGGGANRTDAPADGGDAPTDGGSLVVVAATATALPFADGTFSAAFASYGAVQFVADLPQLLAEVRRVLEPGGRWVFSVTHPIRWAFPDDPGPDGLTATMSYFDRTPYVEVSESGEPEYAEFHRTLGDYIAALVAAGFSIEAVVEPEWPEWNHAEWGGWSPLRGAHLPGTLILGCRAPLALRPTTLDDPNG